MKKIISLFVAFAACAVVLHAQEKPSDSDVTPKKDVAQPTTISSDKLQLDLTNHKGTFLGKVRIEGLNFQMSSNEAVVYLSADNKPERFTASGDIKIQAGDRLATSHQAEYFLTEKKIVLTGEPTVMEKQNKVTGNTITIYPAAQKMEVSGRTTVQLYP
jgi:lipopolysaccharide export system protein LptA